MPAQNPRATATEGETPSDDFVMSILRDSATVIRAPGVSRSRRGYTSASSTSTAAGQTATNSGSRLLRSNTADDTTPEATRATAPLQSAPLLLDGSGSPKRDSFTTAFIREKSEQQALATNLAVDPSRGAEDHSYSPDSHGAESDLGSSMASPEASPHSLIRYALLFINFTFIVSSILMVMAGVVARYNSALQLCEVCGSLSLAAISLGLLQWFFALIAFSWIRLRNILFLLAYVALVILITLTMLGIFLTGAAESSRLRDPSESQFLEQWERDMSTQSNDGQSPLCGVQRMFNCSGFFYGCCVEGSACYPTNAEGQPDPALALRVCPNCTEPPSDNTCNQAVLASARQNLGGFLVITFFSILLAGTGIALAVFTRQLSRQGGPAGEAVPSSPRSIDDAAVPLNRSSPSPRELQIVS